MQFTWGASMLDYDNDGDLDFYFSAGSPIETLGERPQPDALFRNNDDGTYDDMTWQYGLTDAQHSISNVVMDLDRDGWLDVLVASSGGKQRVYRNQLPQLGRQAHWLILELRGNGTTSNRDAVGAVVSVGTPDGETQTCFLTTRPSHGSGGERVCHFGLGANETVSNLRIQWPDGTVLEPAPPTLD